MLDNRFDKFIGLVENECARRNELFPEVEFSSVYIKDKENKIKLQLKTKDGKFFPQAVTMTENEFLKNLEIFGNSKKIREKLFDLIINKAKGGLIP